MRQPSFRASVLILMISMLLAAWIARSRGRKTLKERLIAQMRSKRRELAMEAVVILREHGWLYDGSLRGAILTGSHLRGIDLKRTNLQGAWLGYSDFRGAELQGANLEKTDLRVSMLQGADLSGVYLRNANLRDAAFGNNTRMPDGSHWDCDADISRFTDPHHPGFWHPAQAYSIPESLPAGGVSAACLGGNNS